MKGDIYWNGFGVKTNNCIVLQDGCPGICSNEIIVSTALFCLWCCQLEGFLRNIKPMRSRLDIPLIIVCIKNINSHDTRKILCCNKTTELISFWWWPISQWEGSIVTGVTNQSPETSDMVNVTHLSFFFRIKASCPAVQHVSTISHNTMCNGTNVWLKLI